MVPIASSVKHDLTLAKNVDAMVPIASSVKRGFTLVEVMLAGALLALISLVIMESFIVAVRIAHEENGMVLAADGYAMDAAWTLLNGSYEAWPLNSNVNNQSYTITETNTVLYNAAWPKPKAYITCQSVTAGTNSTLVACKRVAVNVVWGPTGKRRQLWGTTALENGVTTIYDRNRPREIFRAIDINRGLSDPN